MMVVNDYLSIAEQGRNILLKLFGDEEFRLHKLYIFPDNSCCIDQVLSTLTQDSNNVFLFDENIAPEEYTCIKRSFVLTHDEMKEVISYVAIVDSVSIQVISIWQPWHNYISNLIGYKNINKEDAIMRGIIGYKG